jgi:hypothetical protein
VTPAKNKPRGGVRRARVNAKLPLPAQSMGANTSTQAQIERLLRLLKRRPRHTHELRQHGISHPAARVLDLKRRGFCIESSRVSTVDSDSFQHRGVALYSLGSTTNGGSR